MASSDDLQELAKWSDPSTDASGIQSALNRLWRDASSSRATSDGQSAMPGGIVRTRVANLVTYASNPEDALRLAEQLRILASRHPIRSVLLSASPKTSDRSIAAAVRTYCRPSTGRQVCFEHIQISSADKTGRRLASIVSQLIVPELPTILWWAGSPSFTSKAFASLAPFADLLVFDTAEFDAPVEGLAEIGDGLKRYSPEGAIADLNWNRLADWRELIAQFFDHEAAMGVIGDIREIEISISSVADPVVSAQALLLISWLASRLGWSYDSGRYDQGALRLRMRRGPSFINIGVTVSAGTHWSEGAVCSVRIDAGPVESQQRFLLSANSDGGTASAEYAPGQSTLRRFSLMERSTADLMAEELAAFGSEHALDEALDLAILLAERLRATPLPRQSASR